MIKTPLRDYQQRAVRKGRFKSGFALFMEPGTGKTLTILTILARHHRGGRCNLVLVVGPKVSQTVWSHQIREHLDLPTVFTAVTAKTKTLVAEPGHLNFVFINPESAWRREVIKMTRFDAIVVDESHCLKNRKSKQSKGIAKLSGHYRYILTGTPIDKDHIDLWAQWRFCKPDLFGESYKVFEDDWCKKSPIYSEGEPIPFVHEVKIRPKLVKKFLAKQKPFSYTIQKQDLPSLAESVLPVTLPHALMRQYTELRDECITEIDEHEVVSDTVLSSITKLAQLTSGIIRDTDDELLRIDTTKLDAIIDMFKINPEPTVVFCRFIKDIEYLNYKFDTLGYAVSHIRGDRKDDPKGSWDVMLVQTQSGSVSIDLTRSRFAYFAGLPYSYALWQQALSRVHRSGQSRPVTVYPVLCINTIDELIWKIVQQKKSVTGFLYEELKKSIDNSITR